MRANAIAIDLAPLNVLNVIEENKDVCRFHQLKITDVRKKIRLHYGNDHGVAFRISLTSIAIFLTSSGAKDWPVGRTTTLSAIWSVCGR